MLVVLIAGFVVLLFIFTLLKIFSVKYALRFTLIIGLCMTLFTSISLWFNYKASFGEQDGIAISNKMSYWIITDGKRWSQELCMNYFIYSSSILLLLVVLIGTVFVAKRNKIV